MQTLAALRRHIASLESHSPARSDVRVPTGHEAFDRALDGGLAKGRVHEFFAVVEDEGAAAGLALILTRLAAGEAPMLWLRTTAAERAGGVAYGPGLAALGIDPKQLTIGTMRDDAMLLRAAVEALRCPGLGALAMDLRGRAPLLDLTASRRLALAAEASGVTAFMVRIGGDPTPSAADTRWQIGSAPSLPLPGNAPGKSAFELRLLRRRAGRDGLSYQLVWDNDRGRFEEGGWRDERHDHGQRDAERDPHASLSGAVVSVPADRPAAHRAA